MKFIVDIWNCTQLLTDLHIGSGRIDLQDFTALSANQDLSLTEPQQQTEERRWVTNSQTTCTHTHAHTTITHIAFCPPYENTTLSHNNYLSRVLLTVNSLSLSLLAFLSCNRKMASVTRSKLSVAPILHMLASHTHTNNTHSTSSLFLSHNNVTPLILLVKRDRGLYMIHISSPKK